jgi:hypothetical protein
LTAVKPPIHLDALSRSKVGAHPRFDPPRHDLDQQGTLKIRVECQAGYRAEEEPRAFSLGERRFAVEEIVDRWLDPSHRYFKVKVDDGRQFVLRHDTATDSWELAALVGK